MASLLFRHKSVPVPPSFLLLPQVFSPSTCCPTYLPTILILGDTELLIPRSRLDDRRRRHSNRQTSNQASVREEKDDSGDDGLHSDEISEGKWVQHKCDKKEWTGDQKLKTRERRRALLVDNLEAPKKGMKQQKARKQTAREHTKRDKRGPLGNLYRRHNNIRLTCAPLKESFGSAAKHRLGSGSRRNGPQG